MGSCTLFVMPHLLQMAKYWLMIFINICITCVCVHLVINYESFLSVGFDFFLTFSSLSPLLPCKTRHDVTNVLIQIMNISLLPHLLHDYSGNLPGSRDKSSISFKRIKSNTSDVKNHTLRKQLKLEVLAAKKAKLKGRSSVRCFSRLCRGGTHLKSKRKSHQRQ